MKASGEKVRDDEKRLKKMAKRQEKIKSKSAKTWYVSYSFLFVFSLLPLIVANVLYAFDDIRAERKETVSSTVTAKIAKRNNNIAARVKQAKDKKSGIKTKSKSVKTVSKSFASRGKTGGRAGFEGKKK